MVPAASISSLLAVIVFGDPGKRSVKKALNDVEDSPSALRYSTVRKDAFLPILAVLMTRVTCVLRRSLRFAQFLYLVCRYVFAALLRRPLLSIVYCRNPVI